jgi:phosphoglycolate phosphatase-like HAD superfamily hydrolase
MLFSGYIFDVEGTLVDSVRQNLPSLQETLAGLKSQSLTSSCNFTPGWTATRPFNSLPLIWTGASARRC